MTNATFRAELLSVNHAISVRLSKNSAETMDDLAAKQQNLVEQLINDVNESGLDDELSHILNATLTLNESVVAHFEKVKLQLFYDQLDLKKASNARLHYEQTEQL